jgi:hypothetical protein
VILSEMSRFSLFCMSLESSSCSLAWHFFINEGSILVLALFFAVLLKSGVDIKYLLLLVPQIGASILIVKSGLIKVNHLLKLLTYTESLSPSLLQSLANELRVLIWTLLPLIDKVEASDDGIGDGTCSFSYG